MLEIAHSFFAARTFSAELSAAAADDSVGDVCLAANVALTIRGVGCLADIRDFVRATLPPSTYSSSASALLRALSSSSLISSSNVFLEFAFPATPLPSPRDS